MIRKAAIAIAALFLASTWLRPLSDGQMCMKPRQQADADVVCLANAVYYEARGEGARGQRAVVDTIYNRAVQSHTSICAVVKAKRQFQWYRPSLALRPIDSALRSLLEHAESMPKVLSKHFLYFYSGEAPVWAKEMQCKKIGRLEFCREKNK